jgi:hypothetical protein
MPAPKKLLTALAFAVAVLVPSTASAATQQLGTVEVPNVDCTNRPVWFHSGLVVPPGVDRISAWETRMEDGTVHLLVLRPTGAERSYEVVAKGPAVTLGTGLVSFPADLPVRAGDEVGFSTVGELGKCVTRTAGSWGFGEGDPAVGAVVGPSTSRTGSRPSLRVTLESTGTPIVQGGGVSRIGTDFSIEVLRKAGGVIGGRARFANPTYETALREGDVSCVRLGTRRAVFGIVDTAGSQPLYREFYVENGVTGIRLTGLLTSTTLPQAGAACRRKLPRLGTGGVIRSGSVTFPAPAAT